MIEPLVERYNSLHENYLSKQDDPMGGDKYKKHREKIFGKMADMIEITPVPYQQFSYVQDASPKEVYEFISLPIWFRAKYIAYKQIKQMIEIYNRHLDVLDQNRRDKESGSKRKNGNR